MKIKELNKKDFDIFYPIFKEFEKAPFFEKWTKQEIYDEFEEFIEKGKVFTYENKGIINVLPNFIKSKSLPSIPRSNLYISDIVVLENYRKQGVGSCLFDFILDYSKKKYDFVYLRTNLTGSMIEPIAAKRNFEIIKDEFNKTFIEEVEFLRQNGNIEKDKRKYLGKRIL